MVPIHSTTTNFPRAVQFSRSVVSDSVTSCTAARQTFLSITNSRSLLKLMSIKSVMPSNHLILCHPLLLLPSIIPSFRVFSNESVLRIRWPEYWSFSFTISPSNEYSGLISFRMDWLDLLAVLGVVSKTTVQKHQFVSAQLSLYPNSRIHTLLLEKSYFWLDGPLLAKGSISSLVVSLHYGPNLISIPDYWKNHSFD